MSGLNTSWNVFLITKAFQVEDWNNYTEFRLTGSGPRPKIMSNQILCASKLQLLCLYGNEVTIQRVRRNVTYNTSWLPQ